MTLDWTIRFTDVVMIAALILGPIAAVLVSDKRQRRQTERGHKEWAFRTLLTTKSAPLAAQHIDAINLTGLIFKDTSNVVEAWKLYRAHLDKGQAMSSEWWIPERERLFGDLVHKMAVALSYPATESEIKNWTSYYPGFYSNVDAETAETRRLWLEVLQNKRGLALVPFSPPTKQPEAEPEPSERSPSSDIPTTG